MIIPTPMRVSIVTVPRNMAITARAPSTATTRYTKVCQSSRIRTRAPAASSGSIRSGDASPFTDAMIAHTERTRRWT